MTETLKLESAVAELKLFKKTKDIKDSKMTSTQQSLSKLEATFNVHSVEVHSFCDKVEKMIHHIGQTYFDVMSKSNEMMQFGIGINPAEKLNKISTSEYHKQEEKQEKDITTS